MEQATSPRKSFWSLNYNVKLVFIVTLFQSLGRGVWMGNILSAYIFFFANESNEILGLTSASTGLAMTLVVFPAGYLADKYRRDWLLRAAGVFGLASLITLALADSLLLIFVSLVFWGLFQGVNRPSLESIFADSVPSGERSYIYARVHFTRTFFSAVGPFLNVLLFTVFENTWTLTSLKKVMLIGLLITSLSVLALFLFDDDKSLGDESDAHPSSERSNDNKTLHDQNDASPTTHVIPRRSPRIIPYILVASNVIIGFGAGMTIKFFPIFFIKIYDMSPITVQLIWGFTSVFTGIAAILAQRLSLRKGRAELIFLVQALATLCLLVIAFYPPVWLLIPVFIARGSLMNASQPLSRSILMDIIPKNNRGKWNSIEAVAWGLFWNVSAALGGYLIEGSIGSFVFGPSNNFRLCFLVTVVLYSIGTSLILIIVPLVGKEKLAEPHGITNS